MWPSLLPPFSLPPPESLSQLSASTFYVYRFSLEVSSTRLESGNNGEIHPLANSQIASLRSCSLKEQHCQLMVRNCLLQTVLLVQVSKYTSEIASSRTRNNFFGTADRLAKKHEHTRLIILIRQLCWTWRKPLLCTRCAHKK